MSTLEVAQPGTTPPRTIPLPEPSPLGKLRAILMGPLFVTLDVGIFLLIWQILQSNPNSPIKAEWVPPPSAIASAFWELVATGTLWPHLGFSLTNYLLGVGASIIIGIPVGMLLGANRTGRTIGGAYVWVLYSTPIVAIQPILTIIFGYRAEAKIVLITLISVFAVIVNMMDGMATMDQSLLKAGRVFGASRLQLFTKVIAPALTPWLINGARYAAIRGLIGLLISEIYGSFLGVGTLIIRAAEEQRAATSYAAIIVIVLMATSVVVAFNSLERLLSRWRTPVII